MKVFFLMCILFSFSVAAATEKEFADLKKRIEELEKQQELLISSSLEPKTSVGSFLNDNLTLGGFFDGGYNFIAGSDTKTQFVNNSNYLGLNLSADLGNKYRFVSQFVSIIGIPLDNVHNDPRGPSVGYPKSRQYQTYTAISLLTQGYVEYNFNRLFNLQGGIGYVPFGYSLQLREPVLYVRRSGPQLVKQSGNLVTALWSGLHLYGSKAVGSRSYGYDLYTFTPQTKPRFVGLGARSWFSLNDEKFVAGVSAQIAENEDETFRAIGTDARFDFHPFQIRTEFAEIISDIKEDTWTAYVEPGFWIYEEEVLLYVFGDYFYGANNETTRGAVRLSDPIQKWEYGMGVNWLPTSFTRIRFGFTYYDYVGYHTHVQGLQRDYMGVDMSVGVAF